MSILVTLLNLQIINPTVILASFIRSCMSAVSFCTQSLVAVISAAVCAVVLGWMVVVLVPFSSSVVEAAAVVDTECVLPGAVTIVCKRLWSCHLGTVTSGVLWSFKGPCVELII